MNWETKTSEHYIFHFFKNSFAEKEIDFIIENQEKEYKRILEYLGTENNRIINYYIYPDNETKEKITGKTGNASSNWKTFVIDVVYNENKKCIGAHEETHLLSLPLGVATPLLREGLAVFMSGIWHQKSLDYWAKTYEQEGKIPDFSEIIIDPKFGGAEGKVVYPCIGSFTDYLVKQISKEKFFELYGLLDEDISTEQNLKIIESTTGKSLKTWQSEWMKNL